LSHTVHKYGLGLPSCGCAVVSLLSASVVMPEGCDFSVFIATFTTGSELPVFAKHNRCRIIKLNMLVYKSYMNKIIKHPNWLQSLGCRSQHSCRTNSHLRKVMPQQLRRFRNPSECHPCGHRGGFLPRHELFLAEQWNNIIRTLYLHLLLHHFLHHLESN